MTVVELKNKIDRLLEEYPNAKNDEIYFLFDGCDVLLIDELEVLYDIEDIGRYICLH